MDRKDLGGRERWSSVLEGGGGEKRHTRNAFFYFLFFRRLACEDVIPRDGGGLVYLGFTEAT